MSQTLSAPRLLRTSRSAGRLNSSTTLELNHDDAFKGLGLGLPQTMCRPSPEHKIRIRSVPAALNRNGQRTLSVGASVFSFEDTSEGEEEDHLPYLRSPSQRSKSFSASPINLAFPIPPFQCSPESSSSPEISPAQQVSYWSPSSDGGSVDYQNS